MITRYVQANNPQAYPRQFLPFQDAAAAAVGQLRLTGGALKPTVGA